MKLGTLICGRELRVEDTVIWKRAFGVWHGTIQSYTKWDIAILSDSYSNNGTIWSPTLYKILFWLEHLRWIFFFFFLIQCIEPNQELNHEIRILESEKSFSVSHFTSLLTIDLFLLRLLLLLPFVHFITGLFHETTNTNRDNM